MKKRIRKRKSIASAKTNLKQKIQRNPSMRNVQFVNAPTGAAKMSDMLDELIEPFADAADTEGAYTNLVSLGAVAWNTAVLPPNKLEESLALLDAIFTDKEDNDVAKTMLFALMKRKLELFPDEQRMIVDFSLTPTPDGWDFQVASTLPPPQS